MQYEITAAREQELKNTFCYHAPITDQPGRYAQIRRGGYELAELIERLCPPSRERSLAITNLQQVTMWANASIACNEKAEESKG